jgi:hypothetical protein
VALVTLFPYMIFRAQSERAIGRVESIIAAAQQGAMTPAERSESTVQIETRPEGRPPHPVETKSAAT